ncbi:hypothetical protein ALC62_00940, partial [Cyphomyrmex costatus]
KKKKRDERTEIGNSDLTECEPEEPAVRYLSALKNKDRNKTRVVRREQRGEEDEADSKNRNAIKGKR